MEQSHSSDTVEQAVMAVLRERLRTSIVPKDDSDYINVEIKHDEYSTDDQFKRDYAYLSFLRKWKGFTVGVNREWTAFSTWQAAEKRCFSTNKRLELETSTGSYSVAPRIISDAQRKISRILGPLDFEKIALLCRFGNGATFDLRRGSTHADKSRRPSVTFDAIPWVCRALKGDDYLGSLVGPLSELKLVRSNRMVMVPKSAKTDRPIAAEPTLNSYVQQGIGRYIRQRLKRFGVDLDDQTINQDLARIGQEWHLATLDLSSASDTLCANLVKLLLPPEWFEMLNDVRCKYTTFKGRDFSLSKFSSMGNAFTFELESLIFYALLEAACSCGVTSVYGDDFVVHDDDYHASVEVLTWAGFVVNESKSFHGASRFRESCGKHYFDGQDVTPCYQKDVCRRPHDFVRLHNRLVRAGIRLDLRDEFNAAANIVRERCRESFRKGSPGTGPLVEYDEYFIKESYTWTLPSSDRVLIRSAVTLPLQVTCDEEWRHVAYFGRKLRCPSFLNPDREGQCSETKGSKLLVIEKYHWRSATITT